jgi:16S rRNA (cytosine967-C5)-methyltransferase
LLAELSAFPVEKVEARIRGLFRLGVFQLYWLSGVPDYAALNVTVEMARTEGLSEKSIRFLNGLLRSAQRQRDAWLSRWDNPEEPPSESLADWALWASLPEWIVSDLLTGYGRESLQACVAPSFGVPPLAIRVNTLTVSVDAFLQALTDSGIPFSQPSPLEVPEALLIEASEGQARPLPTQLPGFTEGWYVVQDVRSSDVTAWLQPRPGETVVDLCAAPGTKTAHIAARMAGQGRLFAVDASTRRLEKLQENAQRLQVPADLLTVIAAPGETFSLPSGVVADKLLLDVPCSGLGTLRKHPEIPLRLSPAAVRETLPAQQRALIAHAATLIRPGGTIVYSTCSLHPAENRAVIDAFLSDHPGFSLDADRLYPLDAIGDGFYVARLIRQS